jgi:hypothetical protein
MSERPPPDHSAAVPVAYDESGALVLPDDAEPGRAFRCPGCGVPVVLRKGRHRRAHFAHRSGEGCSSESVLHRAAKRCILRVVRAWLAGDGPRPCVSRSCPSFTCDGGIVQDLPEDVTGVSEEVRLPDGSIADLVLYRGEEPVAAVEVVVTHAVDEHKSERLAIPWMAVLAEDVMERPYWWVVAQDGLRAFRCPACSRRDEQRSATVDAVQARARRIAEREGWSLPPSPPYRFVPHECWRCATGMVVFLWPGGGEHSKRRPPDPIPPTLRHRVTEGWGDYWANCCPRCSAVQGDYYLPRDNRDYAVVRELTLHEYDGPPMEW